MSERARWETLACPCGSTYFAKLYTLRRHTQGGLSEDPAGLRCAACGTPADTGALWQQMQRRKLEEQLAALQTALAATTTPAKPPGAPDGPSSL